MKKKQIEFNYCKYNNTGELIKSGKRTVSPYNLVWDNSQCYLIAGIKYKGVTELRIYRADKIFNLTSLENEIHYPISKNPFFNAKSKSINAEKFMKSVFGMYGSKNNELTKVDFLVKNELIGVIYDKFGFEINRKKHDENYFTFSADIQISNMFFGWISSFKPDEIRILNPKKIKQEYKTYLNEITDVY